MQNTDKISAVILVKNAESTIGECLLALSVFNEVVLLDNGSTDKTVNIAQTFSNVKIFHEPKFCGFGKMKNLACSHATNDYILSIDSDEVLLPETIKKINSLELHENTLVALSRLNYYGNRCMKCCGWYPDFVWRIFNRKHTKFNENIVHEGIIVASNDEKLYIRDSMKHYTNSNLESLIAKMNRYSTLSAQEKLAKGQKSSVLGASLKFFFAFNKDYFFRKGILYGYKGFALSFVNACYVFNKYMKLYELNKTTRK